MTRSSHAFERLVLALCLSVSCAVVASLLVILARLPFEFTNYVVVVLALGLIGIWLLYKPNRIVSIRKMQNLSRYWLPMVLFLFHLGLWSIYLFTYPYFPNTEPPDAYCHAELTLTVLQGAFTSPIGPTGFAGGAHVLFAFVSSYFGVGVIPAERETAAFVESLSVLVAYSLFQRILPSKLAGDYASVAYATIIPAGFVYYASVGAYPNIVGDFFVLTSLLIAVMIQPKPKIRAVVTAVVVESVALISHVSALIFLLLIVGFSVVVFIHFRSQLRGYVISNLGFFLVPTAGVVATPFLVFRELSYVSALYLELHYDLGLIFSVWIHNYLYLPGYLNAILLLVAFVFVVAKFRGNIWPVFLACWFAMLIFLVFIGTQDWRMVLLSFVPGAGLLGILLATVHERLEHLLLEWIKTLRMRRLAAISVMLIIVVVLAAGGPSAYALSHAVAAGQSTKQRNVYNSMIWIEQSTPPNSRVASVGLWLEYRYLPIVADRTYVGDFQLNSTGISTLHSSQVFDYVAVSTSFSGLNSFYGGAFRLKYQNPDVVIFLILTD